MLLLDLIDLVAQSFVLTRKRWDIYIHSKGLADIPFPMKIRDELVNSGRVKPHHVLPQSGWVSYWFHNNEKEDVPAVIELFKLRYELLKPKAQTKSNLPVNSKN